jgi:hypothetical protein
MAFRNKKLLTKHHEILRRAHLGQSNVVIAAELGISNVTVGLILNSSLAQAELQRMRNVDLERTANTPARVRLSSEINEAAELSLKHHLSILRGESVVDEKIKANVAKQHVGEGIYKTETPPETISFRDIIHGLAVVQQAIEEGSDGRKVIDITPKT